METQTISTIVLSMQKNISCGHQCVLSSMKHSTCDTEGVDHILKLKITCRVKELAQNS